MKLAGSSNWDRQVLFFEVLREIVFADVQANSDIVLIDGVRPE